MLTKIREARLRKGLTQKDFAQCMGIRQPVICQVECRKLVVSLRHRKTIAQTVGLPEEELFDENGLAAG